MNCGVALRPHRTEVPAGSLDVIDAALGVRDTGFANPVGLSLTNAAH